MSDKNRFGWSLFGSSHTNEFSKLSRIIEGEFGSRSHTEDAEVDRLIEIFKAREGKYAVVITRTLEAIMCIVLNAMLEYESKKKERENLFHISPSHINDDVHHGVDAILYKKRNSHPPAFQPLAGIDFTASTRMLAEKKKAIAKKWWTRDLYFNGNGGIITLPHIIFYHHVVLIIQLMREAERSRNIKTYADLQSYISQFIKHILTIEQRWELGIEIHMKYSRESIWAELPHVLAMEQIRWKDE